MDLAVVGQEYFSLGLKNKDGKIEVGHGRGHAGFIVAIQSRIAGGGSWAARLQEIAKMG